MNINTENHYLINYNRVERLSVLANKYTKLLTSIDLNDELLIAGISEGLNKFLSNIYLKISHLPKYYTGDYYTKDAINKLSNRDFNSLILEHMIPKQEYIQNICIDEEKKQRIINKHIDESFIKRILNKYWWIAIITKDENYKLMKNTMPKDWDFSDIFLRYNSADIELYERNKMLLTITST